MTLNQTWAIVFSPAALATLAGVKFDVSAFPKGVGAPIPQKGDHMVIKCDDTSRAFLVTGRQFDFLSHDHMEITFSLDLI
jgi:hypothetical protein